MKFGIALSAMMMFGMVGFSQSASTTNNDAPAMNKKHCQPSGKAACCAHAAKSCGDKSSTSASSSTTEAIAPVSATKQESAAVKND